MGIQSPGARVRFAPITTLLDQFRKREREPWSKHSGTTQNDLAAHTVFLDGCSVNCGHTLNYYTTGFASSTVPLKYCCAVHI